MPRNPDPWVGATADGRDVPNRVVLEGEIAVEAALRGGSRPVTQLLLARERPVRADERLLALCRAHRVEVRRIATAEIERLATGRSHGGVIAFAGPRRLISPAALAAGRPEPFLVLLDGFEDPFNYGHAVRALYAAGADGLVVRDRDWTTATSVVARASAGASELLPTAAVSDPAVAVAELKGLGVRVVCAAETPGALALDEADLSGPLLLVLGGERRGIGRAILALADLTIRIPYGRAFPRSLGLTAAASVAGFEVARQRRTRRSESA